LEFIRVQKHKEFQFGPLGQFKFLCLGLQLATTGLANPCQTVSVGNAPSTAPCPGHPRWRGCNTLTSGAPSMRSSPTALWLRGEMAGQVEGLGDSPERWCDVEAERSSGAVGFCSGDGSPVSNGGFPMVL
jgi:hypothetical protein